MPVGTSLGAYFESDLHHEAGIEDVSLLQKQEGIKIRPVKPDSRDENELIPPPTADQNVLTPKGLQGNREQNQEVLDPNIGEGIRVSFKRPPGGPQEPAGALKSQEGTPVAPGENSSVEPSNELPDVSEIQPTLVEDLFGKDERDIRPKLKQFYESVKNAFSLPGDVFSGKVPAGSPQEIERAADLAGLMVMGPAPVARKMADGTLGSFAGVRARTANVTDLVKAQRMEVEGVLHPDEIYQKTGWMKGPDRQWKFEIDDSKAKIKSPDWYKDTVAPTKEVIDHPELFKAYPWLGDTQFIYEKNIKHGGAYWDSRRNAFVIGPDYKNDLGVFMHEIQHAIQDYEGFGKGGAPGRPGSYQLKYQQDFEALKPEMERLYYKWKEDASKLTSEEADRLSHLGRVAATYKLYSDAGQKLAAENYARLAGEVEARNTETRLLMSADERRKLSPAWTRDVESSNQIVERRAHVTTTPYGYVDPVTGDTVPASIKDFRRAANDNLPEGHPDRPYNPREPGMIGSKEMDDHMERQWNELVASSKRVEERLAQMKKLGEEIDKLHAGRDISELTELEKARSKKLGLEWEKLYELNTKE